MLDYFDVSAMVKDFVDYEIIAICSIVLEQT